MKLSATDQAIEELDSYITELIRDRKQLNPQQVQARINEINTILARERSARKQERELTLKLVDDIASKIKEVASKIEEATRKQKVKRGLIMLNKLDR